MQRSPVFLTLISTTIFAQIAPTGSISGVIRDPAGKPLPKISLILTGAPSGRQTSATGEQGEYRFEGLPPALYRLTAQSVSEVLGTKAITLDTGQSATVNMAVSPSGTISGRVLDQNRDPVAGFVVALVASVYKAGEQAYDAQFAAEVDKDGKYLLIGVKPGLSYRLLAMRSRRNLDGDSKVPDDRAARSPELSQAWFPNSSTAEAASPIILFPGEQREAVDIRLGRSIPRCLEATLQTPEGPAALDFQILDGRGTQLATGKTQAGGRLRHCLPERTELRIVARAMARPVALTGSLTIPAGDKDVGDLPVVAQPPLTLRGVVELEGDAPAPAGGVLSISVSVLPTDQMKSTIPGQFSLTATPEDLTLSMSLANMTKGSYIKRVTYAGVPLIANRLRLGGATGAAELRIAVARDGGSLSVLVQDEDGKPVPDAWAVAWPAGAASEGEMSTRLWAGPTNSSGAFVDAIKPGKYLVLAGTTFLTLNTETIARYWSLRGKAIEVEIAPNAAVHLTPPLTQ